MDVYQFIQQQPNASQYFIRLARDDMRKPSGATWETILRVLGEGRQGGGRVPAR
jgi:hypothetical protein